MRIPEIQRHMHEELALRWHLLEYKGGVFFIRRRDTAGFQCSWDRGLDEKTQHPKERIIEHRRRAGDALLAVKREIDRRYPDGRPMAPAAQAPAPSEGAPDARIPQGAGAAEEGLQVPVPPPAGQEMPPRMRMGSK